MAKWITLHEVAAALMQLLLPLPRFNPAACGQMIEAAVRSREVPVRGIGITGPFHSSRLVPERIEQQITSTACFDINSNTISDRLQSLYWHNVQAEQSILKYCQDNLFPSSYNLFLSSSGVVEPASRAGRKPGKPLQSTEERAREMLERYKITGARGELAKITKSIRNRYFRGHSPQTIRRYIQSDYQRRKQEVLGKQGE
jgi:hypothetical protein